jgi:nitrogenase subunit NifH
MKTIIEVSLKNDTNSDVSEFSVILDRDQLTTLVQSGGPEAGNKAIAGFVNKFVEQFNQKLGEYLNK